MHTPGPWKLESSDGEVIYGTDRRGENLVVVYEMNTNPDDKKLILAAPEMLALCVEMRNWLRPEVVKEPDRSFFWKLQSIIDRATSG